MANVRLLRQLVQDYEKRVANVNEQYRRERSIYEKAVDAYNADLAATKAGTPYLMPKSGGDTYALFGGSDRSGNIAYQGSEGRLYDKPLDNSTVYITEDMSGEKQANLQGESHWVRNPDGTATLYVPSEVGGHSETHRGSSDEGDLTVWYPGYGYVADRTVKIFPEKTPTAPTMGDPGGLNLTEKEKGLLQRPTLGPSEMNMANAMGGAGTSSLAGETPTAPTSAFANPEDPSNLKERGVLARVLGGQL